MISETAKYDAKCWAEGKSKDEIRLEIEQINKMWEMGRDFQFPKNAHYQHSRMETLKHILTDFTLPGAHWFEN